MDAVKAASQIDHEDSIAHGDPDFELGVEPRTVKAINGVAYLDGVLTEELIEDAELDHWLEDESVKKSINEGLLENFNGGDIGDVTFAELKEFARECEFTEEQVQVILDVQSRCSSVGDITIVEQIQAEYNADHLAEGSKDESVAASPVLVVVAVVAVVAIVAVAALVYVDISYGPPEQTFGIEE